MLDGPKNPFISKVRETSKSCSASNFLCRAMKRAQKLPNIVGNAMMYSLCSRKNLKKYKTKLCESKLSLPLNYPKYAILTV